MKYRYAIAACILLGLATPASAQYCGAYCREDMQATQDQYRRQYEDQWFQNQQLEEKLNRQRREFDDYQFQQQLDEEGRQLERTLRRRR